RRVAPLHPSQLDRSSTLHRLMVPRVLTTRPPATTHPRPDPTTRPTMNRGPTPSPLTHCATNPRSRARWIAFSALVRAILFAGHGRMASWIGPNELTRICAVG